MSFIYSVVYTLSYLFYKRFFVTLFVIDTFYHQPNRAPAVEAAIAVFCRNELYKTIFRLFYQTRQRPSTLLNHNV